MVILHRTQTYGKEVAGISWSNDGGGGGGGGGRSVNHDTIGSWDYHYLINGLYHHHHHHHHHPIAMMTFSPHEPRFSVYYHHNYCDEDSSPELSVFLAILT